MCPVSGRFAVGGGSCGTRGTHWSYWVGWRRAGKMRSPARQALQHSYGTALCRRWRLLAWTARLGWRHQGTETSVLQLQSSSPTLPEAVRLTAAEGKVTPSDVTPGYATKRARRRSCTFGGKPGCHLGDSALCSGRPASSRPSALNVNIKIIFSLLSCLLLLLQMVGKLDEESLRQNCHRKN